MKVAVNMAKTTHCCVMQSKWGWRIATVDEEVRKGISEEVIFEKETWMYQPWKDWALESCYRSFPLDGYSVILPRKEILGKSYALTMMTL